MKDNNRAFISVIIPTYNRAYILENAIKSVLQQTYDNFEIVIVDDCSSDNTEQVVKSITDNRIRYIQNEVNKGPSGARNVGIKEARGELIAFQDSDTIWCPNKLEKQINLYINGNNVGMIFHPYHLTSFNDSSEIYTIPNVDFVKKNIHNLFSALLSRPLAGTPTMLIPKKVFEDVGGFNENLFCWEDYELSLRIAEKYTVLFDETPLLESKYQAGCVSENIAKQLETTFYILTRYDKYYKQSDAIRLNIISNTFNAAKCENILMNFIDLLQEYRILTNRDEYEKISIIIPCYNVEISVKRCLDSILTQTIGLSNLEIILINNASTDSTLDVLMQYENIYPLNIMIINCEHNNRPGAARNIGMTYATGKYIMFIDSNDMIDVTALEKMYLIAEEKKCEVVECNHQIFTNDTDAISSQNGKDKYIEFTNNSFRKWMILNTIKTTVSGRLYRKDFLDDHMLTFSENIYYEDIDFSGLTMFLHSNYYELNESLYFKYQDSNKIIHSQDIIEKIEQHIETIYSLIENLDSRGYLDNINNEFLQEFEYYCTYQMHHDYMQFLANSIGNKDAEKIYQYLKKEVSKLFPKLSTNIYMNKI